jgi:hypothetical protein
VERGDAETNGRNSNAFANVRYLNDGAITGMVERGDAAATRLGGDRSV